MLIDNAEYLDVVIPMYNLIEYSRNYRKTTGSLLNYYRDEPVDLIRNSGSFKYKASIIGKTAADGNTKEVEFEFVAPLKYISNFWRTLGMPLINCEVNLILTWYEDSQQHGQHEHKTIHQILKLQQMQHLFLQTQNWIYQSLLCHLKTITNYYCN